MTRKKKVLLSILGIIILLIIWQFNLVSYLVRQGYSQMKIVFTAQPIEKVLKDENFPDSLKKRLELIQEIRQFAKDSIGLKDTENYTTFYDQKGKPMLYLVTASPAFKIEAHRWKFPFFGYFPYKGFFEKKDAKKEANQLKKEEFDTKIGIVNAWSTLGYFKDPIFSNMLYRQDGELARVIIHELTHATIFLKDKMAFNENLATFIGDEGAKYYLISKYGKNSKSYLDYIYGIEDTKKLSKYFLNAAQKLDSLYLTFSNKMSLEEKNRLKKSTIKNIKENLKNVDFYDKKGYSHLSSPDYPLNNAFFISFKVYRSKQNEFEKEFKEKFDSNFLKYVNYLKEKYVK